MLVHLPVKPPHLVTYVILVIGIHKSGPAVVLLATLVHGPLPLVGHQLRTVFLATLDLGHPLLELHCPRNAFGVLLANGHLWLARLLVLIAIYAMRDLGQASVLALVSIATLVLGLPQLVHQSLRDVSCVTRALGRVLSELLQ